MSYSVALCAGPQDVSDSTESEHEPRELKNDSRDVLLDYLYENSMVLADAIERIKARWEAFGLATRLTCVDVVRILEGTMLVTVTEEDDDSDDEFDADDSNTAGPEKNIFL